MTVLRRCSTPDGRWHYRRSLASRVTLLTTMAVGLAVAIVALGAYVTVRMQLQSSLDDSLVERARGRRPPRQVLEQITNDQRRSRRAVLGAADVRIGFVRADGAGPVPRHRRRAAARRRTSSRSPTRRRRR